MPRKKITDQRRQQIFEGFFECLSMGGHEQITIKDIARAANVSYGVMHYYFKSKKEIVFAFVEDYVGQQEELLRSLISASDSPWERLRKIISFLIDKFIFDQKVNRVFLNLYQMASNDEEIRNCMKNSYAHYRKIVQDVIEFGISRGEFARVNPEKSALLFVGCIEGIWLQISMDPALSTNKAIYDLLYENVQLQLDPEKQAAGRE
ncbi:MAG: TetR/AcrR family transcriptional regulator [Candidatus Lindowbacteria bacterium]|nr:TetR/AcrR family transcriptional regulator [Candidatus Lindowbacteria bacterium]